MIRAGWRAALIGGTSLVAALALQVDSLPRAPRETPRAEARVAPDANDRQSEIRVRFDEALVMLHAKQFDNAAIALQRLLELAPKLPEAHVNMGYALLGLREFEAARTSFDTAIELRPTQANAYYGLALADEGRRDLLAAIGAMRVFLHLSHADHPHRSRARAAIWEWEAALGRIGADAGQDSARARDSGMSPPRFGRRAIP